MEFDELNIKPSAEGESQNKEESNSENQIQQDQNVLSQQNGESLQKRAVSSNSAQVQEPPKTEKVETNFGLGSEILDKVREMKTFEDDHFIYGITDTSNRGFVERINDFFIERTKVTLRDKSYFFHMLAVMVDAGIPVVQAVKSLAARATNPKFRRILNTIAYNAEHGSNLSDAMSRFDNVFDDSEIGIIRSGEATGRLNVMLFKLSERLDKNHELQMKLWGAAVYPIAVLVVLVLVATGMLLWVFPTLLNLLGEGGIGAEELPTPTKILLFIQTGLTEYWWLILLVVFGLYGMFVIYKGTEYGAIKWDFLKLRMPIAGTLMRKVLVLRSVAMIGLLIESGLPVLKALEITANSMTNRIYKLKIQEVSENVKVGHKISDSMGDSEFLYPAEVVQMLNVGESSASLGGVAEKVSDQFEKEVDNSLKKLTSVFEPLMILFVGGFVALLALAIMAPIFNLSSAVG